MKDIAKAFRRILIPALGILFLLPVASCDDNKSYSDMLREEEIAVNWYLAQNKVEVTLPEDSVLLEGPDAPFYKMNGDGTVYMRVINKGDMDRRPEEGDRVYFRFMCLNIKNYYDGGSADAWEGNAWDMGTSLNGTSLIYGNTTLESTTQYGTGIQVPLEWLGYGCEVDIVIKSIEGFSGNISQCIPYVYNIRYYNAEY